ncbi:unnamed protein product [Cylicostephanus goldi]|uniref:7TM GPCR serpentine receptor class x (Srx) domain-containing protein n=1 Tax=Cylicostephanus goldi TaxID=71465 RepID=A0A3P6RP16_CYLGO|nr:unnamed protein product [Cylicostephanus goldi]
MYNQSLEPENDADNIIAGLIMILTGMIGSAVNFVVMLLIIKTSSFHSAFGYICFSHLIAASAALLTGTFWTGPVTVFFNESVTVSFVGAGFGQLMHLFWFVSMYSHLQVAVNRLIAVARPFLYK